MCKSKHQKSVSFEDDDEIIPFPSFDSTSDQSSSINSNNSALSGRPKLPVSRGALKHRTLPIADHQPSDDSLLEEDRPLLGEAKQGYVADYESDNDSVDWEWDQSMEDDVEESAQQGGGSSTSSLFGGRQWSSLQPSKMLMDLMDTVNVHLKGLDFPDENNHVDQPQCNSSTDEKSCFRTPNHPRPILPEHTTLALTIASATSTLSPRASARHLRNILHYSPGYLPRLSSRPSKNLPLKLYAPHNSDFSNLEHAWQNWRERIGRLQVNLISVSNTRANLIEAGCMLLKLREKREKEFRDWQPGPVLVEYPGAQNRAWYVVRTVFCEGRGGHKVPKGLREFVRERGGDGGGVMGQIERLNEDYRGFIENFDKVMTPLRYVQVQFRNLQMKLEHALAVDILLLRKAIMKHEELEREWCVSILGKEADPDYCLRERQQEEQVKEYDRKQANDRVRAENELMDSLNFLPTLRNMPCLEELVDVGEMVNIHDFFNPPSGKELASHSSTEHHFASTPPTRTSRSSSHTTTDTGNNRDSMDTAPTSIDDVPEEPKLASSTVESESTGLDIHHSQTQKGKGKKVAMAMQRTRSAHDIMTEIMTNHAAARVRGHNASSSSLPFFPSLSEAETKHPEATFLEMSTRHEIETLARQETPSQEITTQESGSEEPYTSPCPSASMERAERIQAFGEVEFENVRMIHKSIMVGISERTDRRCVLGVLVGCLKGKLAREG